MGRYLAVMTLSFILSAYGTCMGQTASKLAGGSADSAVREFLARDLSPILTTVEKEHDDEYFLTSDLNTLLLAQARNFDADPYTGVQDATGFHLDSLVSNKKSDVRTLVTAQFTIEGEPNGRTIIYDMRLAGGRWLVYDIDYVSERRSIRSVLSGKR